MKPTCEVIGIYPVPSWEPCHLIEIRCQNNIEPFEISAFTQEYPEIEESSWQAPYLAEFLSEDGHEDPMLRLLDKSSPSFWRGTIRLAFFFHYLNRKLPLSTPSGKIKLVEDSQRPERLAFMKYSKP